ncbi:MAG: hypothetical protein K8J31_22290, partial [Anaerolineae bacterium]|nr:hypothetical protein [Anaerolineae bacterium]
MLKGFSPVELILFALVWIIVGALPGFYVASAMNRNPRRGAQLGSVAGAVIGFGLALSGLVTEVQGLVSIILLLWGVCLLMSIVLAITKIGHGNHQKTASMQQTTADLAYGLLLPTFVIVIAIVVFPMIWNIVLAFRPVRTVDLPTLRVFSLDGLTLDNFDRIFRRSETFFEVFWPTALNSLILLAIVASGWFGGRFVARRRDMQADTGAWVGLLASLIIVILVAGPPQYGNAISDLLAGRSFLNTLLRTFVYTLTGT